MNAPSDPRPLRAHMALCLLGFRGSGYSPEFIAAMRAVVADLEANPQRAVQLVDTPDPLCSACPHLREEGCTLGGADHEPHMQAQDREVLRRLGLEPGATLPWAEVRTRIAGNVGGGDLEALCTTCPWLPLGVCRESVDALRQPPQRSSDGA